MTFEHRNGSLKIPGGRRVDPEVALGGVHAALGGADARARHVRVDPEDVTARVVHVALVAFD